MWRLTSLLVAFSLAGCLDGSAEAGPGPELADASDDFEPYQQEWAGEFLAAGIDDAIEFTFDVPNGATEVEGVLTWNIPGAALDFALIDPSGTENGNGWGESPSHRYVTSTYDVIPGEWTAIITIQQGVDVHFDFRIEARQGVPFGPISGTYEVPANSFAEVNLNMIPGDHFTFDWTSESEVYFNVHFHNEGTTDRPIEYRGSALDGNFSAPANEVYSMLWRNEGLLPVTVTFEMDGQYRLHSMTRDPPA